MVDGKLEQLYLEWKGKTGDAHAAATLAAAQWRAGESRGTAADDALLNLRDAAAYLGYNSAGLRKIVKGRQIQFVQNGRGPIKFRRQWLDDFIATKAGGPRDVKRSPVQRRRSAIAAAPSHGFDPDLFHADSHKGAA